MKKFLVFLFFICFTSVYSNQTDILNSSIALPKLNFISYALVDAKTGIFLAGENMDKKVEPASLTKIATIYLVFKALKSKQISEDDYVTISEKAWRTGGSRTFIDVGEKVQVRELIQGSIVQSGNDATIALAEHISGSEEVFVDVMNKTLKKIGLDNTNFTNVSGMPDPNHYTNARDMAILSKVLIEEFPILYKKFSQKEFVFNNIKQSNRNMLLDTYDLADGIKTGHTESAGYCLAASAKYQNTRLVLVVFGAESSKERFINAKLLLTYGFKNYKTVKFFSKNQIIGKERIWGGSERYIDIGFNEDVFVTLSKYENVKVSKKINLISKINAPIKKNQILGNIDFIKNKKIIATRNIYALKDIEEGNIYRKVYDYFSKFFI